MDLFWSKKICSFTFLLYKARNSHILSFLHSFYALLLSSIFFFSFPYSRACLFHFFSVFNFVNFSFEWNFHMESLGDWARNRQNTKHAMEVAFFPLSCHILWENTRLCLRKQRFDPGSLRRQPTALKVTLEPNLDEDQVVPCKLQKDGLSWLLILLTARLTPSEEVSSLATAFQKCQLFCFLEVLVSSGAQGSPSSPRTLLCWGPLQSWPCWLPLGSVPTVEASSLHSRLTV